MARFNGKSRDTDVEIVDPRIERYLYELAPRSSPVLAEMEVRAEREDIPIVGPLVGRLFSMLARMVGARRVMELGSAIGYSTLWWAEAVGPQGKVFYTDAGEREAAEARAYSRKAGLEERIVFLVGDALERMAQVEGEFDVVFCDIDKEGYPAAFPRMVPRIRSGGLLVVDNTLWSGRILDPMPEPETEGVRVLNRMIADDPDLFSLVLPLRDGVTIALKR